ncbi:hypothetical protein [Phyllobacterium sp. YR531]|uniref:DUF6894 family protein n=1 Tax=Phyllobacterium sp. YR531 TaxID=1144343 RepID=UPI00059361C7|nr:hypothetical protein [Phyllobacterium sp. YR531]
MHRYYFDLHNGDHTRDDVGLELPSREHVTREVARILTDVARDELAGAKGVVSITVRDENGHPISVSSLTYSSEWLDEPEIWK